MDATTVAIDEYSLRQSSIRSFKKIQSTSHHDIKVGDHLFAALLTPDIAWPLSIVAIDTRYDASNARGALHGFGCRVSDIYAHYHSLPFGQKAQFLRWKELIQASTFQVDFECYIRKILYSFTELAANGADTVNT